MNDKREYFDGAFYFGCVGQPGHYWFNTCGYHVYREHFPKDFPTKAGVYGPTADGVFAPGGIGEQEGVASLWHGNGWTILAFWDRSVDERPACNSNFFLRGTYDFDDAVMIAKRWFPFIWERFPFEVTLFQANT